ncbi:late competence protein ComER [Metabacillus arenae]|uniref:Late competence protein ComER n=1 Tax=Metabacillus arenae TaxID=2771434 RepID=A0A926NIP7_9BACI|nr:late competence protein ComER [Metabacillus arenae]MBD1382076.1 late competence protein ComER [Metabacillus arenae]
MNTGFIGTGNMGRILIEAFLEAEILKPSSMFITNRTIDKAIKIKKTYPSINIVENHEELAGQSKILFICVKPLDIHPLLDRLRPQLTKEHCIVSITSPFSVTQLERLVNCQVARVIPSITNRALAGVSLITYGNRCSQSIRKDIEGLFEAISTPIKIEEDVTRISSDIVSCGPAFLSYILQQFIDAAVKETRISRGQAIQLTSEMVIGLGKLLEKEIYTLPTLQDKVCVKGGVTGEGIKVLESEIGDMFEKLFQSTHAKYYEDIKEINEQFESHK